MSSKIYDAGTTSGDNIMKKKINYKKSFGSKGGKTIFCLETCLSRF